MVLNQDSGSSLMSFTDTPKPFLLPNQLFNLFFLDKRHLDLEKFAMDQSVFDFIQELSVTKKTT